MKILVNEKKVRKQMIEKNIKSISELSAKSSVSKPTIYDYFNGKSPVSQPFIKLCECLELDPREVINIEEGENDCE